MKTVRYVVYGIFLLVAFRAAEQPASAFFQCQSWGCSADRELWECYAIWEPVYDYWNLEQYWEQECNSWGPDAYFSGWSCVEDPQDGYFHFYCSFQSEPCE